MANPALAFALTSACLCITGLFMCLYNCEGSRGLSRRDRQSDSNIYFTKSSVGGLGSRINTIITTVSFPTHTKISLMTYIPHYFSLYICLQKHVHFTNLPRPRPSKRRHKQPISLQWKTIQLHLDNFFRTWTTQNHKASLSRSECFLNTQSFIQ